MTRGTSESESDGHAVTLATVGPGSTRGPGRVRRLGPGGAVTVSHYAMPVACGLSVRRLEVRVSVTTTRIATVTGSRLCPGPGEASTGLGLGQADSDSRRVNLNRTVRVPYCQPDSWPPSLPKGPERGPLTPSQCSVSESTATATLVTCQPQAELAKLDS